MTIACGSSLDLGTREVHFVGAMTIKFGSNGKVELARSGPKDFFALKMWQTCAPVLGLRQVLHSLNNLLRPPRSLRLT